VTFEILPAIDVAGGRLVSISGGGVRPVHAFGGSPLAAAGAFVEAGATWLHVVDVDRAGGGPADLELARSLAGLGARVQASGGIASADDAGDALEAGAERVVLSSSVLSDRDAAKELIGRLGPRGVVGIESDGRTIRPRARDSATLPLGETLEWIRTLGPERYVYTSLARVASLAGPDVDAVKAASLSLGGPLIAAGGVRTVDDVETLVSLGSELVEGCVIGRALYEGLDLATVFGVD
jgi:phosphoribosylformimino-5-aminoimidazole carboxamide ribonucleotide (ProFAR) isomerase